MYTCIHINMHSSYVIGEVNALTAFAVIEIVVVYAADIGEENSNPQLKLLSIIYELWPVEQLAGLKL